MFQNAERRLQAEVSLYFHPVLLAHFWHSHQRRGACSLRCIHDHNKPGGLSGSSGRPARLPGLIARLPQAARLLASKHIAENHTHTQLVASQTAAGRLPTALLRAAVHQQGTPCLTPPEDSCGAGRHALLTGSRHALCRPGEAAPHAQHHKLPEPAPGLAGLRQLQVCSLNVCGVVLPRDDGSVPGEAL